MKEKTKKYFSNLNNRIKFEITKTRDLWRNVPGIILTLFVVAIICMNLLANKTMISFGNWFALDGGFLVSWMSFLTMDIVTKHFGPKAATRLSIVATVINLVVFILFLLIGSVGMGDIHGYWGSAMTDAENTAINNLFKGSWFVLLSSTIAFLTSAVINNFSNFAINKTFKKNPDGKAAYFTSTYVSTTIGQFIDNLLFAVFTFMIFGPTFGGWDSWTFLQCITCSATGAIFELIMEIIFSPIGYKVTKKWKKQHVGELYINMYGKE